MAKNQVVTNYDDAGYPSVASAATPLTATGAVKAAPGRLLKMIVTTALSAAVTVYDNTAAASGTILFATAATPAVGTIYDVNLPAVNGVYASFAGTGAITFGYA
jgi:hypothetical protein